MKMRHQLKNPQVIKVVTVISTNNSHESPEVIDIDKSGSESEEPVEEDVEAELGIFLSTAKKIEYLLIS
jgi:hypothetical protein